MVIWLVRVATGVANPTQTGRFPNNSFTFSYSDSLQRHAQPRNL